MTCKQCVSLLSELGKQKELLKVANKRIKVLEQDVDDGIRIDLDRDERDMVIADGLEVVARYHLSQPVQMEARISNIVKQLKGSE